MACIGRRIRKVEQPAKRATAPLQSLPACARSRGKVALDEMDGITVALERIGTFALRLMDLRLGLLINFGAELIKGGISRIVDRLEE